MSSPTLVDSGVFPTSEKVVEGIVLYYYGIALNKAKVAVKRGDVTLKGALRGYPRGSSLIFMGNHALSLIDELASGLGYSRDRITIFQRQELERTVREVLRSSPLASDLFSFGLDVRVTTSGVNSLLAEIYEPA